MLVFIYLLCCVNCSFSLIHNFNEYYSTCEYNNVKENKNYVFPNKVWKISSKTFSINFQLCSKNSEYKNLAWLENLQKRKISLGRTLIFVEDEEVISYSNGDLCTKEKNYSLSIQFECSDTVLTTPRLINPSENNKCDFIVKMMNPNCQPKCTFRIQGNYLIDLRKLDKVIQVETFSLNLCGSNSNCHKDINACDTVNNVDISETKSQSIYYEITKNELIAKGHIKNSNNKIVNRYEVLIKCNWDTELSNITHVRLQTQGTKYKFHLESSLGCIQIPHNCLANSYDNFKYNLTRLYSGTAPINVKNSDKNLTNEQISLSICGPVVFPQNTTCSKEFANVCGSQNLKTINYGSVLLPLTVENDLILADFVSGSICNESQKIRFSTRIKFICSEKNEGPIFDSFDKCLTVISWKTPNACPIDKYVGKNCVVQDRLGSRNLQRIYDIHADKKVFLTRNSYLRYNLCGKLHNRCAGYSNASFCLISENNDSVAIGWENTELVSENGILKIDLNGEKCRRNEKNSQIHVNFACSYEKSVPMPNITVIEDSCEFKMTVYSDQACTSENKFEDCIYKNDYLYYDLSPLMRKNNNYEVSGINETLFYLNICGPVINNANILCRKNTMVCLKNDSPNIKHRFLSIGGIGKPKIVNGTLLIESSTGMLCEDFQYYRTIIYLKCSDQERGPAFLEKDKCVYKFNWETNHACSKKKIKDSCLIKNSASNDKVFDLSLLSQKSFKINMENYSKQYKFNLCQDSYLLIKNDSYFVHSKLIRNFATINNILHISLDLKEECNSESESDKITKVVLELVCNLLENNDYYEKKSLQNCVLTMILKTHFICTKEEKQVGNYQILHEKNNKEKQSGSGVFTLTSLLQEQRNKTYLENKFEKENSEEHFRPVFCFVPNPVNKGDQFNLSSIKTKVVFVGTNNYSLNFADGGDINCRGIFCKNNEQILTSSTNCPMFQYNSTFIQLHYASHKNCSDSAFYHVDILLRCANVDEKTIIKENGSCSILMEHFEPEICKFFKTTSNSFTIIFASTCASILLLLFIAFSMFLMYRKGYCLRFRYLSLNKSDKRTIEIYRKDTQL